MRHLLVMMNDGVFSRRTGAGRANENMLQFIGSMGDHWARVTIVATKVSPDSPAWDERVWRRTEALLSKGGWDLLEIPNGYELRGRYAGIAEWSAISHAASDLASRVTPDNSRSATGLLSSDVPFLGVVCPRGVTWLHVTHTLATLQAPDDADWCRWEVEAYGTWLARNGRLAVPSNFLRTSLLASWPDLASRVSLWRYGFPISELRALPVEDKERRSVLAYGRALPRKGLHLVVAAVDMLQASGLQIRLTLIAIPEAGADDYFRQLSGVADASASTRLLTSRVEDMSALYGHDDLAAVVVPSMDEPTGLAPVETYCWGAGAVPVVVDSGGLVESVDHATGIVAKGWDAQSLAEAIRAAVELSVMDRFRMVEAGRQRFLRDYHLHRNAVQAMTACGLLGS
ncbi:glycosyltransferase [Dactylosporangium sp. NPDC000244]|uniref:glycosyltransferase family 4 protein n=1 Tax=Dactylosporangium sp. NPDC000244 TaxID=3154365 RepID=UPI003318DE84